MNELAVTLLRLSYLLVLWLFVLAVLATLRKDVYGLSVTRRKGGSRRPGRGRSRVTAPADTPAARGGPAFGQAAGYVAPAATQAARELPTKLVVLSGPLRGTTLPLGAGIVIGRSSSANLVLDDEFTSGRHARILPDADGWVLEDLGSTNGTFLGREQITAPARLRAGQQIRIGQTRLELARS